MLLEPLKHQIIRLPQRGKRNFKPTPHHSCSVQLKTELNKRRNSSPTIRKIDTPVSNKTVSNKPSRVDFDIVINKPSKQQSLCSSKTKDYPVIEVKQTVKHSDE